MGYKVRIDKFEGPFDLLVYLIESARMSIYDIQVSEITAQYLAYVEHMQAVDVAVSSEFMVLAAELIELKSKMLLPKFTKEGEVNLQDDPRETLVEKLLEYKKFKGISDMLARGEERGMCVYEKPQEDISMYTQEPDEYLSLDINKFVSAFHLFLQKKKKVEDIRGRYERLEREHISIEEKISFMESLFMEDEKKKLSFMEFVKDKKDKYEIALSFSSLLELIKKQAFTAEQKALFGEIMVAKADGTKKKEINH